ncbi:MAG: hypothetical protein DHS80DRAFT_29212 [Piptocephalis tieghemiana]|nr:MAG: hypothetical protein DHS80DRAFT_29212 [Piptocephalis tieghemiana]
MRPVSLSLILALIASSVHASYVATAPATSPSTLDAPVTSSSPSSSSSSSSPSSSNSTIHFADGVQDKSSRCVSAVRQLPKKFPLLSTCYPLVDLYHTPIEEICEITPGRKGCFQVTVDAAREVASNCLGPSANNITALFEMPDVYRNWANLDAAKAACSPAQSPDSPSPSSSSPPRPCLNSLSDMLLTVQELAVTLPSSISSSLSTGDFQAPSLSDLKVKVCSSTCAANYYTSVNGYSNLAPTLYYAGSTMQPILFAAFRKYCSWAAPSPSSSKNQGPMEQKEWMSSKGYPSVDTSAPSPTTPSSSDANASASELPTSASTTPTAQATSSNPSYGTHRKHAHPCKPHSLYY